MNELQDTPEDEKPKEDRVVEKQEELEKTEAPKTVKEAPKADNQIKIPPLDPQVKEIFDKALAEGAIDDGQILTYAYQNNYPDDVIGKIRKTLGGNKCTKHGKCPFQNHVIKFEDAMKNPKIKRKITVRIKSLKINKRKNVKFKPILPIKTKINLF